MNTKSAAALLVLLCVIVPLGLGFAMPSGQETTHSWVTTGNPINISDSLHAENTPYYYDYTGTANNAGWSYATVSSDSVNGSPLGMPYQTDTNTSIPALTYAMAPASGLPGSSVHPYYKEWNSNITLPGDGWENPSNADNGVAITDVYELVYSLVIDDHTKQMSLVDGNYKLDLVKLIYIPSWNKAYAFSATGASINYSKIIDDFDPSDYKLVLPTGQNAKIHMTYVIQSDNAYIDPSQGIDLRTRGNYAGQSHSGFLWYNGSENREINLVFRSPITNDNPKPVTVQLLAADSYPQLQWGSYDDDYNPVPSITVYQASGAKYVRLITGYIGGGYEDLEIYVGKYTDVRVSLNVHTWDCEIAGLSYSDNIADTDRDAYVQKYDRNMMFPANDPPDTSIVAMFCGTRTDSESSIYVQSTNVRGGVFQSYTDQSINLSHTYGFDRSALLLTNVQLYGNSITLGNEKFPVVGGAIEYDVKDSDGSIETNKVNIGGNPIFAIRGGDGITHYYIDGNLIASVSGIPIVRLDGTWAADVNVFEVQEEENKHPVWAADGGFHLTVEQFAAVGIATAFIAAGALALYGRRNGGKVGALVAVAVMIAFVYIVISGMNFV